MNPADEGQVDILISDLRSDSSLELETPILIKRMKLLILKPLTHIFNLSLSSGVFPAGWEVALVTPIHIIVIKVIHAITDPSHYFFSKLLEKLVNKRLVSYLNKNNICPDRQFGFWRGK